MRERNRDWPRLPDFIDHIIEAIERIERYCAGLDEAAFLADEMRRDAVIRNLEIIGEASKNIGREDPAFPTRYPDVPWGDMYDTSNRLSHGYFHVSPNIVWSPNIV